MSDILQKIVADLAPLVAARRTAAGLEEKNFPAKPDFRAALPGVIAEVKKASPSKGLIREDFAPVELAKELAASGASALSVLTEPNYFLGSTQYLRDISATVAIPTLCKDFIFDPYQILEARHAGASAVLLIAALLPQDKLIKLAEYARSLDLDILGEAHDENEVARLLDSPVTLIGVNARNLRDFSTDLKRVEKLIGLIPQERFPIAESAIRTAEDIHILRSAGARGFLVGETLMRAPRPGAKLRELLA